MMTRLDEAPLWPVLALFGLGFALIAVTPLINRWIDRRVCRFANQTGDDDR